MFIPDIPSICSPCIVWDPNATNAPTIVIKLKYSAALIICKTIPLVSLAAQSGTTLNK